MTAKHNFSLIEIMVALGVVLIGICSVMVLFPVAANASRDSAVEIESAHAAEQFLNYMKYQFENNPAWLANRIDSSKPTAESEISEDGKWTREQFNSSLRILAFHDNDTEHKGVFQQLLIRSEENVNLSDKDSATTLSSFDDIVDKRLMLYVWYVPQSSHKATVHLEVSWPAEIPYANRQKNQYILDLSR